MTEGGGTVCPLANLAAECGKASIPFICWWREGAQCTPWRIWQQNAVKHQFRSFAGGGRGHTVPPGEFGSRMP